MVRKQRRKLTKIDDGDYYCYDCHFDKWKFVQGEIPKKCECAKCGNFDWCIRKVLKFNRITFDELDSRTHKEKLARGVKTCIVIHRTTGKHVYFN